MTPRERFQGLKPIVLAGFVEIMSKTPKPTKRERRLLQKLADGGNSEAVRVLHSARWRATAGIGI